jgi:hypothetical protein
MAEGVDVIGGKVELMQAFNALALQIRASWADLSSQGSTYWGSGKCRRGPVREEYDKAETKRPTYEGCPPLRLHYISLRQLSRDLHVNLKMVAKWLMVMASACLV